MIIKPPNDISIMKEKYSIFLAGSIEMGNAENWQEHISKELENYDVVLLNPRRDDWSNDWEQSINNPNFKEQVTWEMDSLRDCDLIVVYFDPNTYSPVTLLEIGTYKDKDMIICCQDGFWRKGNVDIFASRYGIPVVDNKEDFYKLILEKVKDYE